LYLAVSTACHLRDIGALGARAADFFNPQDLYVANGVSLASTVIRNTGEAGYRGLIMFFEGINLCARVRRALLNDGP
jgi:hypothetical protein